MQKWEFDIPDSLKDEEKSTKLYLRYYKQPLGENSFIDLTDGISSVADMSVSSFDGRPYSKYINGSLTLTKLVDSSAVKENRKGLEEGDDLTMEIENFITEKVTFIINQIESIHRDKEKEARLNATNNKLNELSKFLSKQDLKFKFELKELQKRFLHLDVTQISDEEDEESAVDNTPLFRKPLPDDQEENLIRGVWVMKEVFDGKKKTKVINPQPESVPEFIPDLKGSEFAIKIGNRKKVNAGEKKRKRGLQVLMSNNSEMPDCPFFGEYDDPVSDRDLVTKGIIWVNSENPIISKTIVKREDEKLFSEHVVNFVLMIIAQYYAQKELEFQPVDEREDPFSSFRKHYFELQKSIREDSEIAYFKEEE